MLMSLGGCEDCWIKVKGSAAICSSIELIGLLSLFNGIQQFVDWTA
jgi:hypothetical protein